jgi:hypothetical protein
VSLGDLEQQIHRDRHGLTAVDGGGQGHFCGTAEHPFEVGTGEAFGGGDQGRHVEVGDRLAAGLQADDLGAGGRIWRRHEDCLVEASRATEGGVDLPGLVGGADDEHARVVAQAVHLVKELVHQIAHLAFAYMAAVLSKGVEVVEDQHAGGVGAGGFEDLVQVALGAAEIRVEDLMQTDRKVIAGHLAGDRSQHEGLAAAGWAVDEDAAAGAAAVGLVKVRELQRVGDLQTNLFLEGLHAADIGKAGAIALGIAGRIKGLRTPVVGRLIKGILVGLGSTLGIVAEVAQTRQFRQ